MHLTSMFHRWTDRPRANDGWELPRRSQPDSANCVAVRPHPTRPGHLQMTRALHNRPVRWWHKKVTITKEELAAFVASAKSGQYD